MKSFHPEEVGVQISWKWHEELGLGVWELRARQDLLWTRCVTLSKTLSLSGLVILVYKGSTWWPLRSYPALALCELWIIYKLPSDFLSMTLDLSFTPTLHVLYLSLRATQGSGLNLIPALSSYPISFLLPLHFDAILIQFSAVSKSWL